MFDKLTLFYSKSTGKIKLHCTGEQSMDYFGEDKCDYNYDFIIVDYDSFILNNLDKFKIVDRKLEFCMDDINYFK
ncbi:hypothetical protein LZ906_007910 [Paraclostridium ghonii]|uniref:hypothetical protein n=1 Tax=Paraclostridium ghonii TaxID=29358 RepID=UPI00202CD0B4|nr:hypothetical protein [Paeniclostridium ghonii]MCM0167680.1 hypothetical protein [Paeniclostridium ghonii]